MKGVVQLSDINTVVLSVVWNNMNTTHSSNYTFISHIKEIVLSIFKENK